MIGSLEIKLTSIPKRSKVAWPSLIILTLLGCGSKPPIPISSIGILKDNSKEIIIKEWQVIGPIAIDTSNNKAASVFQHGENSLNKYWHINEDQLDSNKFLTISKENTISNSENLKNLKNIKFTIKDDYVPLAKILGTDAPGNCYLACTINSPIDQDAIFYTRSYNKDKLWLNGSLISDKEKTDNAFKLVRLKKGHNFVMAKVSNVYGSWFYHLALYSKPDYVKLFYLNTIYSNFLDSAITQKNKIGIRIDSRFIKISDSSYINIVDKDNKVVVQTKIVPGLSDEEIVLNQLTEGIYRCQIKVDNNTMDEVFIKGDYRQIFKQISSKYQKQKLTDLAKINIQTLISRYKLLDTVLSKEKDDIVSCQKKVAAVLYELSGLVGTQSNSFLNQRGWHLRSYRSQVDHSVQNYLVYVPENYLPGKPNALVVSMPYVGSAIHPFYNSTHIANIKRLELLSRLADRHHDMVLIPGSRIYKEYNLNPIVNTEVLTTINEVKKQYSVDTSKMYLYGACSGGLFAALMANRHPYTFAAIGLEGPELSYINSNDYPSKWLAKNSIFNYIENYGSTPIYLMHSKNDYKANFDYSQQLVNSIRKNHGNIILDSLNNATKTPTINLQYDDIMMDRFFNFFDDKKLNIPNSIHFSTAQLRYNKAAYLTINNIEGQGKATFSSITDHYNTITVSTTNINSFSIQVKFVPGIDLKKKLKIIINGKEYLNNLITKSDYTFNLKKRDNHTAIKPNNPEGPINDVFAQSCLVVRGTGKQQSNNKYSQELALKAFCSDWRMNYLADIPVKDDTHLTNDDIKNKNLIVFGTDKSNLFLKKVIRYMPIKITNSYVSIRGRKYSGNRLKYIIAYPNPFSAKRYLLIIGSNSEPSNADELNNLQLGGWFNYEIWDDDNGIVEQESN